MRDRETLVIATWGMPANWQETNYSFSDEKLKKSGKGKFCTTLPLLLEVFKEADFVLLVLDSLVDEFSPKGQPLQGACYECYDELRGKVKELSLIHI